RQAPVDGIAPGVRRAGIRVRRRPPPASDRRHPRRAGPVDVAAAREGEVWRTEGCRAELSSEDPALRGRSLHPGVPFAARRAGDPPYRREPNMGKRKSVTGASRAKYYRFWFQNLAGFVDDGVRMLTRSELATYLILLRDTRPDGTARAGLDDLAERGG